MAYKNIQEWCRTATTLAIKSGKLLKPDKCDGCGRMMLGRKLHAHHIDYKDPYNVTWLCQRCHAQMSSMIDGEMEYKDSFERYVALLEMGIATDDPLPDPDNMPYITSDD